MAGIAFSLFAIIALTAVGIALSMKLLQNYNPGRNRIQADLNQIRSELAPIIADLVPWSEEEMEQLSLNQVHRTNKKGVVKASKGVFTTIYHEPVIAWAYRRYVGQQENGLIYARTSNKEFIYRVKNGEVEMVAGDKLLGVLNAHGILKGIKGRPLAQIGVKPGLEMTTINIGEKMVGGLAISNAKSKAKTRAFPHLVKMDKEEEEVFMSLSILEMVRNEVGR